MRRPNPRPSTSIAACGLSVLLAGCLTPEGEASSAAVRGLGMFVEASSGSASASGPARDGAARRLLDTLAVKGRAPRTGYAREQFGRAWADVDRNGCDTRDDILRRDLTDPTFKPGARVCVVITGSLADPYTGARIRFEHGQVGVDIDHVVALGDAWVKGASLWPPDRRLALANDPLNLLAVDASANRSKGDGDAATWLPPSRAYRCKYVARQIAVKAKYALSVTRAEYDAMAEVLAGCPEEPAPVGDAPTSVPVVRAEPRAPASPRKDPPASKRPVGGDINYGTCKQAKASGKGPYVRGRDPEYAYYRDNDGDGVVCE